MTISILDFGEGPMKTLSDLYDQMPEGAGDSPLVFKTPDGKRFTICGWRYVQDHTEESELVCDLEPVLEK